MNFEEIVSAIRAEQNLNAEVPGFDPGNGNERAKYLLVLETPGPKAMKSGWISLDNPDPSARNLSTQLSAAGIQRKEIAIWNVVPWYRGKSAGAINRCDIDTGMRYLESVIRAMPELRCVVLVGLKARSAHVFLSSMTDARIVSCHHPSARSMNGNDKAAKENIDVFCFIKATT